MALNAAASATAASVGALHEVGNGDLWSTRPVSTAAGPNWNLGAMECRGVCVKQVEGEKMSPEPPLSLLSEEEPRKWNRDLSSLPKPLTVTDLSASSNDSNVRVAYQGLPGAFSEDAALKAYPQCETVPCEQFEVAFKAVELWLVDKAVLPIENSLGGSIHRNYDLLLCHRLHIVGEVQLAVDHCLMALPGVKKEELKRVLSHPQALAQCEISLSKLGIIRESVDDTALAAQIVNSKGLRDAGAIASARAAQLYGLDILERKVQDFSDNITRFLILAREPIIPRTDRPFKTSIVFTLEEGPGVIFKALAVFALRSINLSKIESRPQRKRPLRVVDDSNHGTAKYFDYLFYIDFEASMAETRAQNALSHLQVMWLPYGSDPANSVPRTIYTGWLLYRDIMEPYMPIRVLRQLGYVQPIPNAIYRPQNAVRSWAARFYHVKHPYVVALDDWNMFPLASSLPIYRCESSIQDPTTCDGMYLTWYYRRSHPQLLNEAPTLAAAPPSRSNSEYEFATFLRVLGSYPMDTSL